MSFISPAVSFNTFNSSSSKYLSTYIKVNLDKNASERDASSPSLQVPTTLKSLLKLISLLFSGVNEFCVSSFKVIFLFPVKASFNLSKFSVFTYVIFFNIKLHPLILADIKIPGLNSIIISNKLFLFFSSLNNFSLKCSKA